MIQKLLIFMVKNKNKIKSLKLSKTPKLYCIIIHMIQVIYVENKIIYKISQIKLFNKN
jgi:hypothetical protein